jgi:hypothetical protein
MPGEREAEMTKAGFGGRRLVPLARVVRDFRLPKRIHAKVALHWCHAITTLTVEANGKKVSEEADDWWLKVHYGKLFLDAVEKKNANFLKQGPMLSIKAVVLGDEACRIAGTAGEVTLEHAKQASLRVDCKADGPKAFDVWCEAPPGSSSNRL